MADVAADAPAHLLGLDQIAEPVEEFAASPGSILR
jgi:hypothetical protein